MRAGPTRLRLTCSLAVAAALAAAAAGCGFGAGEEQSGSAELVVTRDYGAKRLLSATVEDPPASETVARLLDREAEIETSFGGNFVDSIEGISGGEDDGGRRDWFFFVNGYWSPIGAAEARVRPGDKIWWDHRPWQDVYRVPAVVGSWPEPFAHGFDGVRYPTVLDCEAPERACEITRDALRAAGATLAEGEDGPGLRVLVGELSAIADDPDGKLLGGGPGSSGVYAVPGPGARAIRALDSRGEPGGKLGPGSGLVAAVRPGEAQPTWLVTGAGNSGVLAAARALTSAALQDHYALAIEPDGDHIGLPESR